jgi:glutamate carboxypeptidase
MADRADRAGEIAAATAWLDARAEDMESALRALVEENSYTSNIAGGNRVGALLRQLFESSELTCQVRSSSLYADHLVFGTNAPGAPIALVGHLDTVFPPGGFEGYRREGTLARGPGVLDMKGGLVVAGFALLALRHIGRLAELPIRFVVVSDEEIGSPEGQPILRAAAQDAVCGLVFEAGRAGDAVVTRRKGTGGVVAVAHGRAAHAGNVHHEGASAIRALARFVDYAEGLTDYRKGTTVNVGRIEGGEARNTVPDLARAELDIRFVTADDGERLLKELEVEASRAAAGIAATSFELSGGISRLPLERTAASAGLYAEYAACAVASGLAASEAPLVGGGSDASTLSPLGVPCIDGLGPRGAGFHTKNEHIEVATLVPKAQAVARFLLGRLPVVG